jgi:hypothetical protein
VEGYIAVKRLKMADKKQNLSIFEILMDSICCIMCVDRKITNAERKAAHNILLKTKAPWSSEEIDERISNFILRVKKEGLDKIIQDTCDELQVFKEKDKEQIFLKCFDYMARADGVIDEREKKLCEKFKTVIQKDSPLDSAHVEIEEKLLNNEKEASLTMENSNENDNKKNTISSKKQLTLIHQNPFRVLGLPVTATDREIAKSISDLSIFVEMGKTKEFDCDFFFPIKPHRTQESITGASQKIEQPYNKLFHALFWFWENPSNTIDEMAFEELRNGNTDRAIQFWKKSIDKDISDKNCSNYKNLAVLYLGLSSISSKLDKTMFLESINISGKFLTNGHFEEYAKQIIGFKNSIDHLEVVNSYVDEIISLARPYLNKADGLSSKELIKNLSTYPSEIQNSILDKFIGKYVHNIKSQINICLSIRTENVSDANKAGFDLYEKTKKDMKSLTLILSESDLEYQLIADKLANEIVECSICYFNKFRDSERDPGDDALKLSKYATEIAVGEKLKERINQGMPILIEYVKDKPKRERLKQVKTEVDRIHQEVKVLNASLTVRTVGQLALRDLLGDSMPNKLNKAATFLNNCKASLNQIKNKLGVKDTAYIELCDLVANSALGMCVVSLNEGAKKAERLFGFEKNTYLTNILTQARPVFNSIGKVDMSKSSRDQYVKVCRGIGFVPTSPSFSFASKPTPRTSSTKQTTSQKSGCYIATMVYGSYDAGEVMVLRKFRDNVLQESRIGRILIKIYCKYSPLIVKKTKHLKIMHVIFKSILNPFVNYLKAKNE